MLADRFVHQRWLRSGNALPQEPWVDQRYISTRDITPTSQGYHIKILVDRGLNALYGPLAICFHVWGTRSLNKTSWRPTTFPEQSPWPGQHRNVPPLQNCPLWEHPALASRFGPASAAAKAASASRAMKNFMFKELSYKDLYGLICEIWRDNGYQTLG